MVRSIGRAILTVAALASLASPAAAFDVVFGDSWDNWTLQDVLNQEYGFGVIDAATDYEGFLPGDADPPYWVDEMLQGVLVREIAGYSPTNIMGWYTEDLTSPPIIDGIGDGVIFEGAQGANTVSSLTFPGGVTQFGFYLNPNGTQGSTNAPEPELFYTNRFYNDLGTDGTGAVRAPQDGDVQCLVYNITHLKNGVPTYVLAWEDLDYSSPLGPEGTFEGGYTDNDFQDLVVEISADSPVKTSVDSFGQIKAMYQ